MKIVYGDIWKYPADVICITTNGDINSRGRAIMGAGIALQAQQKHPWIARRLAYHLMYNGSHVALLHSSKVVFCVFPVKYHWYEKASIPLIDQSTYKLNELICLPNSPIYDKIIVLPRPGCGNGGLDWSEVEPIVSILPDNVHIIDLVENRI